MSKDLLKLKILVVKCLTEYTVKEVDTTEAQRYLKLEELMQKNYSICDEISPKEELEIGSYVCVHLNPFGINRRAPKVWLRAVIRNVFMSIGSFLYNIYLLDYGLDTCVKRSSIRELRPHFTETFVRYQALDFHLYGVKPETGIQIEKSLQLVNQCFKSNDSIVLADIKKRSLTNGWLLGCIQLNDGSDLAQLLIDRQLVIDVMSLNGHKYNQSKDNLIPETSVRKPKTSPFIRSANKSFVRNVEHMNDSNATNLSISSISSTDISIASDDSEDSITLNDITDGPQVVVIKSSKKHSTKNKVESNGLPNGVNGLNSRQKLIKRIERLKLIKEKEKKELKDRKDMNEVIEPQKVCPIVYSNDKCNQSEEEIDWPVVKTDRPFFLKPAGVLPPPPPVFGRVYTLK